MKQTGSCPHADENLSERKCGHRHCGLRCGYVNVAIRVPLRGPGPIIRCNQMRDTVEDYEKCFREFFVGEGRLGATLRKVFGVSKVAEGLGIRDGAKHYLTVKSVFT